MPDAGNRSKDLALAVQLTRAGGRAAMGHYGRAHADAKADASPVTEADRAAESVILAGLREAFPTDAVLSEESPPGVERLSAARVWVLDPLDGTKEFLACNGEFSVMLGLVVDGRPELGVVYRPDGDTLYYAERGAGAWLEQDGERRRLRIEPARRDGLRIVGSRSHAEPVVTHLIEAMRIEHTKVSGSVGLKCGLIARGECDLYVHPSPHLKEWDTCAPEIIVREAGGVVADCLGKPLRYNKPDPRQPDGLVVCGPDLIEAVLEHLQPLYAAAAV